MRKPRAIEDAANVGVSSLDALELGLVRVAARLDRDEEVRRMSLAVRLHVLRNPLGQAQDGAREGPDAGTPPDDVRTRTPDRRVER